MCQVLSVTHKFALKKPKLHQRLNEVELTGHGTRRIEELCPIDVGSELLATALRYSRQDEDSSHRSYL